MFIRCNEENILLVQVYVDDIIFDSTNESLCKDFASLMHGGVWNICLMGELTYFSGLQIKQAEAETLIIQTNYFSELLKEFDMPDSKSISTLVASNVLIDKDEQGA